MQFRPCIDIHNGSVKQIVGSSLSDRGDEAVENFVATQTGADFARLYRDYGIRGGHVILLNPKTSSYYEQTKAQALSALSAYPGGLQVGGGITPENAAEFLDAGASHVIVTSYVFRNGTIDFAGLEKMTAAVGRKHLVLDLSCRKYEEGYFVCTDRWQNKTDYQVNEENMTSLSESCDEFLIHAVDVEGKSGGIEAELAVFLGTWTGAHPAFYEKVTYAGGVHDYEELQRLKDLSGGRVNVTIGSALSLFGGSMEIEKILEKVKNR